MPAATLKRVMLVDDESDIQMVARLALEAVGGYTVEVCGSGKEALDAVDAFAPDLILLDVIMPEMDGPATFAAFRARAATSCVPIVFLTGKSRPEEIAHFQALGAAGVIAKPFDMRTLAGQIQTIWEGLND